MPEARLSQLADASVEIVLPTTTIPAHSMSTLSAPSGGVLARVIPAAM
jgi:hypothetical protein